MISLVKNWLRRNEHAYQALDARLRSLEQSMEALRLAIGRVEARQCAGLSSNKIRDQEFQVFSQWGDDGIIEFLVSNVAVPRPFFVEFGIESYREASTRFLLMNRGWQGLVIEGNERDVKTVRRDPVVWKRHLRVVHAFVTRENIDTLLRENGASGPIGLLSIDVDGNDYWIWEAIEVAQAAIVIVEYNAMLGIDRSVTIPYAADFQRAKAHSSWLYFGASLPAFVSLGNRKGYAFVGCNSAGNNAYFVRRDLLTSRVREVSVEEGYSPAQFREGRDASGRLALTEAEEARAILATLPWVEV